MTNTVGEDDLTLSGGYTVQYTNLITQKPTPETFMVLLTPINLTPDLYGPINVTPNKFKRK